MATRKTETNSQKQDLKSEVKTSVLTEAKNTKSKTVSLSVRLVSLDGKSEGNLDLPKEVFGKPINLSLLSQAVRVYINNLKGHYSNTKTRGEVDGSTKKLFRQKGTGHARHGSISAPIYVGGGIALGPKARKTILDLPKKMKKAALMSALSQKLKDEEVLAISDLEKATGKTKQMVKFLEKVGKKSVLIVTDQLLDKVQRSVSNIQRVQLKSVEQLNAYEVIKYQSLILTRQAVEKLQNLEAGVKETAEKRETEKVPALEEVKVSAKTKKVTAKSNIKQKKEGKTK